MAFPKEKLSALHDDRVRVDLLLFFYGHLPKIFHFLNDSHAIL